MRVLEALKILEDATLDCKNREIDTPDVRQALDALDLYCMSKWRVSGFRDHLRSHGQEEHELEGQQQILRTYFGGIYGDVRRMLIAQIGRSAFRYRKTNEAKVKAELDRLNGALEKLPQQWNFYVG